MSARALAATSTSTSSRATEPSTLLDRHTRPVAHFGHARVVELARAGWPTARYGEQVCRRTVQRLLRQGLLRERRNPLGSKSLCLSRPGAAWLELRGIKAQQTLELSSVAGPTFFHRTMGTRYLIERQVAGCQVAGEYLILRRQLPFSIDELTKVLQRLPDGLLGRLFFKESSSRSLIPTSFFFGGPSYSWCVSSR